jgi:putative hydrolase of the HAD superfamily
MTTTPVTSTPMTTTPVTSTPMTTTPVTSIVFDFGGVLISPITSLLDEISKWHDLSMVEMLDVLMGPRETSTPDHPWHRSERGELPIASLQAEIAPYAERAGIALRGDEYDRLLCGEFDVHHDVIDRITRLRTDGYTTGLLTNSFRELREHIESHIDFGLFDVIVDSSEVGCRKPEPEIYDITTARIGGDPTSILYIDDFLANIDGARRAGWQTIHLTDVAGALAELDRILAEPAPDQGDPDQGASAVL